MNHPNPVSAGPKGTLVPTIKEHTVIKTGWEVMFEEDNKAFEWSSLDRDNALYALYGRHLSTRTSYDQAHV